MNTVITKALEQLNGVYVNVDRKEYAVVEHDSTYILVMPNGGFYPPTDAEAMVVRLVNLRICAEGRLAR